MKQRCKEVLERAYLFLDGEILSEAERVEIEAHLEDCAPCLEQYGYERETVVVLARLRGKTPCPDELRSRIANLLSD